MSDIGGSLMAGLMAGFGAWGQDRLDQKAAQRKFKLQQDEAELKEMAEIRRAKLNAAMQAPQFNKVSDTVDGRTVERTMQSRFNPETGQMETTQAGQVVQPMEAPKSRDVVIGDQKVTQEFDPTTGQWKEIGRGRAFAPTQGRAPTEIEQLRALGATDDQIRAKMLGTGRDNAPPGFERTQSGELQPSAGGPNDPAYIVKKEKAQATGDQIKKVREKAEGAKEQLRILDKMQEVMDKQGVATGPIDQFFPSGDAGQNFDILQKQLVGPTIKAMFGSTQLSEGDRKAAEAALPSAGRYETVNKKAIADMREHARKAIEEEARLTAVDEPMAANVPQAAVQALMTNPQLKEDFDRKYGKGAAARILSGR